MVVECVVGGSTQVRVETRELSVAKCVWCCLCACDVQRDARGRMRIRKTHWKTTGTNEVQIVVSGVGVRGRGSAGDPGRAGVVIDKSVWGRGESGVERHELMSLACEAHRLTTGGRQ